ncbi:unnamed protein product [Candidula unifasciata]|uniref:Cyclin-D1-binding protein 1 homolog n=1 Tax=Candidula unifasciata TaxID=100452 RepID=A0A8S4A0G4_9EUPU|nr:unnamed protein product [Candidula unifasciata]
MAASTAGFEQENVIKNLQENIQLVLQQIKDGESRDVDDADFNKEVYWNKVAAVFKILSIETTKISLAFSKKPFPSSQNTEAMVTELEKSMLTLVSVYYALPLSQGTTLHKHLQETVLQILANLQGFVSSLSECVMSESHSRRLQWTGGIWESVDFTLLKDNKECTLRKLKEVSELVQDALVEMEEAIENEGELDDFMQDSEKSNADVWSEQDKQVALSCTGMVKTMKNLLKKTQESVQKLGETDTREGVAVLDELVDLISGVNIKVDDFVCSIYAPVNYTSVVQNGKALAELTDQLLKFLRDSTLTKADDTKWLDFLSHASTHNLDKLKQVTQSSLGEG